MAESDKGSASSKAKEKKSVQDDDDISKDFLGQWSTDFGADLDSSSMDFKFEPVTKGNKKKFNFDELDMDFPLDGGFDKIKTFKLDMGGDLDFSSPPKTSTKSKETDLDFSSPPKEGSTKIKERLQGEIAKSNKGKQDSFAAFSFDFNELDKFDLDAVLPKRTKELNMDDGNKGIKISSVDEPKDYSSEVQLADTDARDADVLKAKSVLVKTSDSKEDQMESKQSKTSSERENKDKKSPVENKTCNESYEELQLQTQSAQVLEEQTQSQPALNSSEGEISNHAQRTDKQRDQVEKSSEHSDENPEVKNQSSWSYKNKMSGPDSSEQMQIISTDNKSGDADSNMQAPSAKVDPPLALENQNSPVTEMIPQHEDIHLQNLPEAESESTDGEKNVPKCNVLQGDIDKATVAENVLHVEESLVAGLSKLGAHAAKCISGRQKIPVETAPSHGSSLTQIREDKTIEAAQALPTRPNLVSLRRNATVSLHLSPSGARQITHSELRRINFDKKTGLATQEATGGCFVSEKVVTDQSAREHSNNMGAQKKNNLVVIPVPNDGKTGDRGTTFLRNEKKKEDTKSSSFHVQSSLLPESISKSNKTSEKIKPKTPTFQSVRKLKMDTVVGKLSALNVSKKMPNLSALKISSSPALSDKKVVAKNVDNNGMNLMTKTFQLIGLEKPQSPGPSMKRKLAEASNAVSIMSHPSKRPAVSQIRNSTDDSERPTQDEVTRQTSLKDGLRKNVQDSHLNSDSDKQPESTFEIPRTMKFAEVRAIPVMENDETIAKAEACGKELDEMCSMLRKKQEEAKELLVRVLVTHNKLLLMRDPMHTHKLRQAQKFASSLLSKELPSKHVNLA